MSKLLCPNFRQIKTFGGALAPLHPQLLHHWFDTTIDEFCEDREGSCSSDRALTLWVPEWLIRRVVHGTYLSVPFPSHSNFCLSHPIPWDVSHGIPIGMTFPWTSLLIRLEDHNYQCSSPNPGYCELANAHNRDLRAEPTEYELR